MAAEEAAASSSPPHEPVSIIVLGMAGSGKTTLMQRLIAHLNETKRPCYSINLDPAVGPLPYGVNIDIRDTVNYKQVMQQFSLGPNGGILTSLNLFATRFDQVLSFVEKRAESLDYILVDTPGQIEVFTWSASGNIITEALATATPTVIVFVIDTVRTTNPSTFMSNVLCACSILYKTRLPFVLAFNKIDVQDHSHALEWLRNYDDFQAAFPPDDNYSSTLSRSIGLVLEEFYQHIPVVGVSALTGEGMAEFFAKIDDAKKEFISEYRPDMLKRKAKMEKAQERKAAKLQQVEKRLRARGGLDVDDGEGGEAQFAGPHEEGEEELLETEAERRERGGFVREEDDDGDSTDSEAEQEAMEDSERKHEQEMYNMTKRLAAALADANSPSIPPPRDPRQMREEEMDQLRRQIVEHRVDNSMDEID